MQNHKYYSATVPDQRQAWGRFKRAYKLIIETLYAYVLHLTILEKYLTNQISIMYMP